MGGFGIKTKVLSLLIDFSFHILLSFIVDRKWDHKRLGTITKINTCAYPSIKVSKTEQLVWRKNHFLIHSSSWEHANINTLTIYIFSKSDPDVDLINIACLIY